MTERGICWNTYGDPMLDDETIQYSSGGLGQYAVKMENLELSTKYYVRAYAKNIMGTGFSEVLELRTGTLVTPPSVSTVEIGSVTATTASVLGNVSDNGGAELIECGVCWGLNANPSTSGSHQAAEETALGVFSVSISGLTPNTTYHVRCYAINEKGTVYGEDLSFITTEGLPVLTTSGITNITATSAKGGGEVTDEGASTVSERGICWSTSHNPTINDSHANSGTGTGSFTVEMNGLTPNATYYVRAYAKNQQGTAYGAEVSFAALEGLPVVVTQEVTDITSSSGKGHGEVTDQGGSAVTERGVCWSTEPSPTVSGSHGHSGTGTGEFEISISNLMPGTTYYVRAYAKNSQGLAYGENKTFTTGANKPTVATSDATSITQTTAQGGGEVSDDGGATVTERGVCWSTSHSPTVSDAHSSSGTGMGSFTVEMNSLEPGTKYYIRAYATNSQGTAYGSEKSFTTQAGLPTVITGEISNITQTTAKGGGNVTDDGGASVTERGICWSTSHNPTTSGSQANSGTGTGNYTVSMTGLTANTKYYVRAYAINSQGTSYGNELSFTTSLNVSSPTVTTSQVTEITETTATGGGNVTADGNATVTERGICWSTSHNPTTNGSHASSGTGTGSFTVNITGLTSGTTYYVRAYAINSAGTSYGSEVSFTTLVTVTPPTVTTSQVTNIGQTTATGGGNVTSDGNATVTERGICWNTSHNPTTSGSHAAASSGGTGTFTVNMTGLTANTTYYVRAYAKNSAGTVYGSEVSFMTLVPQAPTGAINGIFSVSATQQVWFSQGNLQYQASTQIWRFAVHQYDYVGGDYDGYHIGNVSGSSNNNISSTYSGWIDLFGWGTSGFNHGAVAYQPWNTSQNNSDYYAYGNSNYNLFNQNGQADWGYNAIAYGGNVTNFWRTLTRQEWSYLMGSRPGIRFAKAVVNNVSGLILLPDNWDSSIYTLNNTNTANVSFNSNVINVSQWNTLQNAGAVFLPMAGERIDGVIYGSNAQGFYWSSNYYDNNSAVFLYFDEEVVDTWYVFDRKHGRSVRLVRTVQ